MTKTCLAERKIIDCRGIDHDFSGKMFYLTKQRKRARVIKIHILDSHVGAALESTKKQLLFVIPEEQLIFLFQRAVY